MVEIITVVKDDINGLIKTYKSLKHCLSEEVIWQVKLCANLDASSKQICSFLYDNKFINVFVKGDLGIYDAMNQAIDYSSQQFLWFLNAGDEVYSKDSLKKVVAMMENSDDIDLYYCDSMDIFSNSASTVRKGRELSYIKYSLPASHQAIFYRSRTLKEVKYDLSFKVSADYALTATLVQNGVVCKYIPVTISKFDLGGFSSNNRIQLVRDAWRVGREVLNLHWFSCLLIGIRRVLVILLTDRTPLVYRFLVRMIYNDKRG